MPQYFYLEWGKAPPESDSNSYSLSFPLSDFEPINFIIYISYAFNKYYLKYFFTSKLSADVMNFNVCKLFVALFTTFSTIPAFSHSSRRKRVIWLHEFVNETHSAPNLIDYLLPTVFRKDLSSKSILALICQLNCMFLIFCSVQSKHRPKHFLIINVISVSLNDSDGEKWFLRILSLPRNFVAFRKLLKLFVKRVVHAFLGQRTQLSFFVHWVSVLNFAKALNESVLEIFIKFILDNESFRWETHLTTVVCSGYNCFFHSFFQVCVF